MAKTDVDHPGGAALIRQAAAEVLRKVGLHAATTRQVTDREDVVRRPTCGGPSRWRRARGSVALGEDSAGLGGNHVLRCEDDDQDTHIDGKEQGNGGIGSGRSGAWWQHLGHVGLLGGGSDSGPMH